ncbi:hypothetical protein WR25_23697 isoform B [Diploscapter pachys]|nr:hypothetical protein WR25_23697 isoform B [Diploscapter pachys]
MKMMNEESNSLKEIVKVLIEKYGDQLESISEKLKTIRGAFEDECCLHRWLKSEYCIIPYESLFRCGYPKSLIIKMESEEPYFEMRIELVSSPALETFLRLITGDNYFVGDFFPKTTPLHLLNRSLYGTTKDLRLLWDGVEESMDKQLITLLSDMTEQCRGRSVHISHDRNIHMLYVNFGLDDEYEDRGIEVGRVVEHNIKSVVNEGDENESDEEDRDQLEDIEITDIQFIY